MHRGLCHGILPLRSIKPEMLWARFLWYNNRMENRVNCLKCQYYYITWDPARPKGCRFFGFKGLLMPSHTVKATSGQECKAFTLKVPPAKPGP